MLTEQLFDKKRIEKPAATNRGRRESIPKERASLFSKPQRERHGKAFFLPLNDLGREPRLTHFLEQIFAGQAFHFQILRERGSELDELVIEKRDARLQRRGHARFVAPRKQIIGQPELRIHVEHTVQRLRSVGARQVFRKHMTSVVTAQGFLHVG